MPKTKIENFATQSWTTPMLRTCTQEITNPLEGKVSGSIPPWLQGTLIRNGSGAIKIGNSEFGHVFDGSSLLHRFSIKGGRATYQCRFLDSKTLRKNRAANRIVVTEFATEAVPDPCHTIFDRISTIFNPAEAVTDNCGISVYPFGDQMYAMTEYTNVYKIDTESLDTLEKKSLLNSLIVCHTAHPHVMKNGDVYNIALGVVKGLLKHMIVKFPYTEKGDMFDLVEVVHTVDSRWLLHPSYMHSFGITENYFIIIEQPLAISYLNSAVSYVSNRPFSSSVLWYDGYETQIVLVNRNTGEQTRYTTETFFFMHIINCFELDGQLIIDVCSYKDAKIIDALYVEAIKNIRSNPDYAKWCQSQPKRIEIPLNSPNNSRVEISVIADIPIETPRINYELYNGRPYRYFYGMGPQVHSIYGGTIIKVDTKSGEVKTWCEVDANPSEPVFVARPDAQDEDDGVLLSALLWGSDENATALLVLDARDLTELGRVRFTTPSQAPKCFHGWFLPDTNST
ncbi:carotenoid isomerooxygenase-like isoform X1 [Danaus plexippus]|uniref:carotenoid isomerooxygenase-like isoform X1 n=2 Tax=Danaus plexippus TaxID=13037 RepID=UPI002AAF9105|nr:carotenoid isomerooxygenase-like isoform X1 [Danaus plexippus]XP_061381770.1 carotenoid isomerooxygenase-like isoform X1 [Danaus plexippus]